MRRFLIVGALLFCPWVASAVVADVIDVSAAKDNTLYDSAAGSFSNGSGDHFFVGLTQGLSPRRGVLAFDVAGSIPAGSVINAVTLTLFMSKTNSGSSTIGLHPALVDWGEGASDAPGEEGAGTASAAGDATWVHTFYQTDFWSNPGGDYSGIPSATSVVGGIGSYTWSSAAMATDVQGWLDDPSGNFGWIVIGTESGSSATSKRLDSRSNPTASRRPKLTVDFTPPVVDGACCATNDTCSIDDGTGCAGQGGLFQGAGTGCMPNPCTLPTGACCYDDGSCTELASSSCAATGGLYQGDGTTCMPGVCPLPTGACCADAGTCSVETEDDCQVQSGTYQGNGTDCLTAECSVVLEPFVDALPIPPVKQPAGGTVGAQATYDIEARQFTQQLHRDLPPTTLWGYDGLYPGPTIEAAAYESVTVNWGNDLRDTLGNLRIDHYLPVDLCLHGPNHAGPTARTVVHLHGAHVRAEFDGYPEDTILPGQQQTYVYTNDQLPATLWYHDHALGITRLNMYLGLAGFYLIRDPFELSLGLPSGPYEIPLLIQDRTFNSDGSLSYPADWQGTFFGDKVLVNGKVWPYLEVDQGSYRFRLLNGSGSRTYTLTLSDPGMQFQQIGTDGGLLPAPVPLDEITLAPAERADVVLDFAGLAPGTEILLTNSAPAMFPGPGSDGVIPDVMKFVVTANPGDTTPLPARLRPIEVLQETDAVVSRDFELYLTSDPCTGTAWTINGLRWDDIVEYPELGTTEIWRFINRSGMMHPMHMHLVMFQVLDRQPFELVGGVPTPMGVPTPPEPAEAGWKDTVRANPGEITRVIARFEDYKGLFAYHCHIVEHEDQEMMRQFRTIDCGDGELDPTEDCDDGNPYHGDGCSDGCRPEEFLYLTGLGQGGTVQIIVDGVSIFAFAQSGESPEAILQELAAAINANLTLIPRGVTARAEGNVLIVNASLTVQVISDPGLIDRVALRVAPNGLWWSQTKDATAWDVVRGDLGTLLGDGGDFSAATQTCLVDDHPATLLESTGAPLPGQGRWYLVRTAGSGGTYDSGEATQTASRDGGIAFSGNACP